MKTRLDEMTKGTVFRSTGTGKTYEWLRPHASHGVFVVREVDTDRQAIFAGCATGDVLE